MADGALKIVIAGHVDHGKSTLIGRLLHDTGSLPPGKAEELEAISKKRGVPLEWSFVLDALQTERDQAITIDTTRVWFRWKNRRYVIIDAPGHREFVRNMLSGASEADAAVLVVDVMEGVGEQTQRHAHLLQMLGLRQVAVAINKMDAAGYERARFEAVAGDCLKLLESLSLEAAVTVPICARTGENIVSRSQTMPWYEGPVLADAVAAFRAHGALGGGPLRLRVQDVYREGTTRIAVGRIESGSIAVGQTIRLSPLSSTTTVRTIERWNSPARDSAEAGESIGVTFTDPVFVHRGDVISHTHDAPALEYLFRAVCFWLDEVPPSVGEQLSVQLGPTTVRAVISAVEGATDSASLERIDVGQIPRYAIVQLRLRSATLVPIDDYAAMPVSSRLVLLRGRDVVAGGVASSALSTGAAEDVYPADHLLTTAQRERRNGHRGLVLWFSGLSGSGKSTLAMGLERRLFERGLSVYVLDGDNVRSGLNSDLGFSQADRTENIRRVGELAALFTDAGFIVITAFISPMERDREIARKASGDRFHEVYVRANLATCEARDPKGLYKRARAGEIQDFTGVSAPYEPPESPELIIDTEKLSVEEALERLVRYVESVAAVAEAPSFSGARPLR